MLLDKQQICKMFGCPEAVANVYVAPLSDAMTKYNITTKKRIAAFLAQIGHESGRLRYAKEIWGPTAAQMRYERDMSAAWPPTKEDRRNILAWRLGNAMSGDGKTFMGRGLIQVTGRTNYRSVGLGLGKDFIAFPRVLELPEFATLSAAFYWDKFSLNDKADAEDFDAITKAINGGQNGRDDRIALFKVAKSLFA